jgi:hypothetical protein
MTRSGLEPLPLPALIANEYFRLDGWSDHVNSIVFAAGKSLFVWQQAFDRSIPAEKQESNSLKRGGFLKTKHALARNSLRCYFEPVQIH